MNPLNIVLYFLKILGGWSQDNTGSDGLIWKGCLSCHSDNGAFTYAVHNSQEANAGHMLSSILRTVAGASIGNGSDELLKNTLPVSTQGKLLGSIVDGKVTMEGNTIASGTFDFVVMQDRTILLGRKHTFLSGGADVFAAGEMKIKGGKIVGVNNLSGHYLPGLEITNNYLNILKKSGIDISKTHVKIYNSQGQIIKHILPK